MVNRWGCGSRRDWEDQVPCACTYLQVLGRGGATLEGTYLPACISAPQTLPTSLPSYCSSPTKADDKTEDEACERTCRYIRTLSFRGLSLSRAPKQVHVNVV